MTVFLLRRRRTAFSVFVGLMLLTYPATGLGQTSVSVQLENDAFPEWGDDDYTNGLRVTIDLDKTIWWSPFSNRYRDCRDSENSAVPDKPCRRTTLIFGQNFYSPDDITISDVQESERPYAAWLYVGAAARLVGDRRQRTLELHLGTTGKYAFGKEVQTWWHDLDFIGADIPQGWANQVKPVPGLVGVIGAWDDTLTLDRRTSGSDGFVWVEFRPYYRLTVGNVHLNAAGGASFRLGYNLQRLWARKLEPTRSIATFGSPGFRGQGDLPSQRGRSTRPVEFNVFASVETRAVVWNALLQHETYTQRELRPIKRGVTDLETGIALGYKQISGGFRWVWRSPEYDIGRWSKYGGVFLTLGGVG